MREHYSITDNKLKETVHRIRTALDSIKSKPEIMLSPEHPLSKPILDEIAKLSQLLLEIGRSHPLEPTAELQRRVDAFTENPVFLGGVHKSGTTLLRNLLDGHPNLFVLPTDGQGYRRVKALLDKNKESYRERIIANMTRGLITPMLDAPHWILGDDVRPYLSFVQYYLYWQQASPDTVKGIILAIVRALYSAVTSVSPQVADKKFWLEKSTYNIEDTEVLLELFPHARFIHIVRHPAAVIAAQRRRQSLKGRSFKLFQELTMLQTGMEQGINNLHRLGDEVYHIIRYEDLVKNTSEVMKKVADFLGVAFDDILTVPTVRALPAGSNTAHREQAPETGTVTTAVTDYWRKYLTPPEIHLITSYLSPLLMWYNYDSGKPSFRRYVLSLFKIKKLYDKTPEFQDINIRQGIQKWFQR